MKFYHGTTSIFYDSIKQNGLGKINPIFDFKLIDVLDFLRKLADRHLETEKKYFTHKETTKAMCNQEYIEKELVNGKMKTFNFRHSLSHVSLSKERVVAHLVLNDYGSEILTRIILIHNLLKEKKIDFKIPPKLNKFNYEKYIDTEPTKIIIEILDIPNELLIHENGENGEFLLQKLKKIIYLLSKKERFYLLQRQNFEVTEPIAPRKLKFYELEYFGELEDSDFMYTLSRI